MSHFFTKIDSFWSKFGQFQIPIRTKRFGALLFLGLFFLKNATAQCVLGCSQSLQISLDATGHVTITVALIAPYASQNCPGQINLTVYDPAGLPISPVIDCSRLNQTLTAKVEHVPTANICWGSVIIKDYLPPVISVQDKWLVCAQSTEPATTGWPTVSDNCTAMSQQDLTYLDVVTDLPCGTSQNGTPVTARIDRTWKATDANNNTGSFLQKIWIKRAVIADVVFPQNRDDVALPALDCLDDPNNLALAGQPTVFGLPLANNGFCDLGATKTDQIFVNCGPVSKKISRNWQVVDWCSNTVTSQVQTIKTLDKKSPILAAPANLTLFVGANDCFTTVNIPTPTASDDCSGINWMVNWPFGTGFGPFFNVPPGAHIVSFTATDGCGNSATCSMKITVADQTPPSAICKSSLQVTLPTGASSANLTAPTFDGGSYDNCLIFQKLVSRDGLPFAASVNFTCVDVLPNPILVKFKVADPAGNEAVCDAFVSVKDFAAPEITCPPDLTLDCWQDFTHPNVAGLAIATDNCGLPSLIFTDNSTLSACNEGIVNRTWKATDAGANTSTCLQKITILKVPGTLLVNFPADLNLTSCPGPLTTASTGNPTWTGHSCQTPLVTFSDTLQNAPPPACFRIKRNWRVVDLCTFEQSGGASGLFQKDQIITIQDGQPPVFAPLADLVFTSPTGCNQPLAISLPDVAATDCSSFLTITNNSAHATSGGKNASGVYPVGVHLVTFTAADGCGNSATISQKIEVKCTPPSIVSISGKLITEDGKPINNINLTCETDGFLRKKTSNLAGNFTADSLPKGATFVLKPESRTNWLNGISTFDLVAMRKHILNVTPFNTPYKFIAGDINRNGFVTTFDMVELRKLILGIYDSLPANSSWRFVDSAYVFTDPASPLGEVFPEKMTLDAVQNDLFGKNFIAIKIGDVNGTVDPENLFSGDAADRSDGDWPVFLENFELKAGFSYKIPIKTTDLTRLEGFQMHLHVDPKKLRPIGILPGRGLRAEHFNDNKLAEGNLFLSWVKSGETDWLPGDSTIFEWQFECLENARLADVFFLKNDWLAAESYLPDGQKLRGQLQFFEKTDFSAPVFEARPNPFSDETNLVFDMPENGEAHFELTDATGRALKNWAIFFEKGRQQVQFSASDFPNPGVFFVKFSAAGHANLTARLLFFP